MPQGAAGELRPGSRAEVQVSRRTARHNERRRRAAADYRHFALVAGVSIKDARVFRWLEYSACKRSVPWQQT